LSNTPFRSTSRRWGALVLDAHPTNGQPGLEPLLSGRERAKACLQDIGDQQQLLDSEERWEFTLVGPQPVESRPDRGSPSAGFLSSMITSGKPFRSSSMSGRRKDRPSMTVDWLTPTWSLFSRLPKPSTRA